MNEEESENKRFERLVQIVSFYRSEAERCRKTKSFFAGSIMLGAELEGLLLAMVELYSAEVQRSPLTKEICKEYDGRGKKSYYDWDLFGLLRIAKDMGWLPSGDGSTEEKAGIGDYAEIVRRIRNFIHPGFWAREYPEVNIEREDFENYLEVLEIARDWLRAKVERSLKEEIDKWENI